MVNICAYIATDPDELRRAGYLVAPDNERHTAAAVRECDRVVVGQRRVMS